MLFPPSVVYLNAGSFGPLPRSVHDAVADLRRQLASEPMDFMLRRAPTLLWRARETLAEFVGCAPHRLMFSASVSAAVSLIASSLTLAAPGEILLSDQEYQTMGWCWERAAQRSGLRLRTFSIPPMPSYPEQIVEAAVAAMGPQTRLIFFSHVLSANGLVLPARRICEEAQRRGIVSVIDGAHAVAATDLKLSEIPFDFYVGSCHKWLLAPSGASFLVLGRKNEQRLQPLTVSWGHRDAQRAMLSAQASFAHTLDTRDPFGSTPRLRGLECEGTRDICPWLAVSEAIDFHRSFGPGGALARMRAVGDYARARFAELVGFAPATPLDPALSGPMVAFELPAESKPEELQRRLWEDFGIEVAVVSRLDRSLLRLSPHVYNDVSDIDSLIEALIALVPIGNASRTTSIPVSSRD